MYKNNIKFFRGILRILERELGFQTDNEITCCGVSLSQCHIIMELNEKNKTTIKDLSEKLGLDKSTLSRSADSLVESGLLNRIENKSDRRFMLLNLTEKGIEKANFINLICNKYYEELFKLIPENKHSVIIDSLKILSEAMNKLRKQNGNADCCK